MWINRIDCKSDKFADLLPIYHQFITDLLPIYYRFTPKSANLPLNQQISHDQPPNQVFSYFNEYSSFFSGKDQMSSF